MAALTIEARRVHESAHLSDRQIAAATGAKASTVRDWLTGRSVPSGSRAERLVELAEMTERLTRVMDREYIPVWLTRPIEALDDDKPVDVLARGDYRQVAELIAQLEYPGVSSSRWHSTLTRSLSAASGSGMHRIDLPYSAGLLHRQTDAGSAART